MHLAFPLCHYGVGYLELQKIRVGIGRVCSDSCECFQCGQVMLLLLLAVLLSGTEWFPGLSWLGLINLVLVVLYGTFVLVLNVAQRGSLSGLLLVYQVLTWLLCWVLWYATWN